MAIAPWMSLALPRLNIAISFSDTFVYLAFLIYGPAAAIVLAGVETLTNCYYNKWKGTVKFDRFMIATNVSVATISITIAWVFWSQVVKFTTIGDLLFDTRGLVTTLGIFAFVQCLASIFFSVLFRLLKDEREPAGNWKSHYFSSSVSQVVGAGLAGTLFELLNFGDFLTFSVVFGTFAILYFAYRQSIREINSAINKVETAEREKAQTERELRKEAESHAQQLAESLEQQERANDALRKSRRDFKHAALHDSLTGLANRKQTGDILRGMIEQYRNDPAKSFYVLFVDIRRFKNINDSLGHTIGDKVLMIAAKRFVRMVTGYDTVARLGGDEFAIILRNLSSAGKAQKVARRIAQSIAQPFSLSGNRISIGVSIGIAPCDAEYQTPEEILRDADIAMHFAKEKSLGAAVFTRELRERFLERAKLELDLRHAIERNELYLNYQPIVSLSDGRLIGFEALMRWNHHDYGTIPPNKFIPIAEESGLIQPLTVWILGETCRQLATWRCVSQQSRELLVSVNISGKHLSTDDLIDDVELALESAALPADALKLEITESTAMENAEHTINVLNKLKKIGVQLSLDDFGTGYSSLSHLHRLPFDTLKIDRSFVSRVGDHGENSEILQTIISLAKNLKMRVIAEGIETDGQLAVLKHLGCDFGQGYLLAKPQSRENAEKLIYEMQRFFPSHENGNFEIVNNNDEASLPVF